jgi:hypothetical protein
MAYYTSLGSGPSAYQHVSYTSHLHIKDVNNSTGAHFSTDDRSSSGDGIPNFKARITDLETDVKDIKTDLKDIKTEVKKKWHTPSRPARRRSHGLSSTAFLSS